MSDTDKLSKFFMGIITGTTDLGLAALPLVALYKKSRNDPAWREKGFQEWLVGDPEAAELLVRVLTQVRDKLRPDVRAALILALGGLPGE